MSRNSLKNVSRLLDAANDVRREPVEAQFLADLKRSIEMTDEQDDGLPSQTFKPSSMGCTRGSYYQIIGQKPDESPRSFNVIQICNSGSDIHERIQGAICDMKNHGMKWEYVDVGEYVKKRKLSDIEVRSKSGYETKLYNKKYNISFMCDGIIYYKKHYYILEIKSEASGKWFAREGVDSKHYNQAIAYSLSLGIEDVIFLYVDRDMLNMKTFMYKVTDDMRKSIVAYITYVQGYVIRKIVPPKPKDIDKRVCNYCGYSNQCKKDG